MQNKGLVRFMAACLFLVCAYYLSFTFVTRKYEKAAKEYAQTETKKYAEANPQEGGVLNDSVYAAKEAEYYAIHAKEKVWLWHTIKECRERGINLGLDLKGGMNVTMEVSVPDILLSLVGEEPDSTFIRALDGAKEARQTETSEDFLELFFAKCAEVNPGTPLATVFDGASKIEQGMDDAKVKEIVKEEVKDAADNSFNILRQRIDRFGVVQPNIQKLAQTGRILIELPGIKDPKRVEKLLQGTANLEFWETYKAEEPEMAPLKSDSLLNTMLDTKKALGACVGEAEGKDTSDVRKRLAEIADLPYDARFAWTVKSTDEDGLRFGLVALRAKESTKNGAAMEGDVIVDARADFNQFTNEAEVNMEMNSDGAKDWQNLTRANKGRSIAIVLDGYVYSYPNVKDEIAGGRSQISGNFTIEEAKDLANTLKSGKMSAPATIIQSDVVGPSLGREAIRAGLMSFILGFVLILLYMLFYYGLIPGLIADFALVCNLFLLVGILASFKAVLTLPGIAGIVLTMGMAVDANVLIYERIREELRGGKGMRKAIEDGFKGAISAIIDANVTSFLTGAILAYFGTGPIKGFAVTYMIGIVSSFLTAVFITRLLLDDYCKRENAKELSFTTALMKNFLQNIHFDFVKARKVAYCLSAGVIIFALLGLEPHVFGKLNLGIDFSGGRNYVVRFEKPIKTQEVRDVLTEAFQKDAEAKGMDKSFALNVITFGNDANQVRISTNYRVNDDSKLANEQLDTLLFNSCKPFLSEEFLKYGDEVAFSNFSNTKVNVGVMQSQKVGAAIADDIKTSAIWAVFIALIGIFLYILLRFRNFAYSVGALVALAHDTVIILGLCAILWKIMPFSMEIDQAFIAAILTVIGYSINDTVVIFDRVREYNNLYPKREKHVNINDALNNTLSRTFSTSMSTFVVLLAIFIFGGENIQGFVFALLMGVIVGTYSSLFIASPIAYDIQKAMAKRKEKKAAVAEK